MRRLVSRAVAVALPVALLATAQASAATFVPTTTADGNNGSCTASLCTLRDAIAAANAGPGNDVSVPAGNYTLSLGELLITQNMTVAGAGARTTSIDAQGTSRVMEIASGGVDVTVRDLTITGGHAIATSPTAHDEGGGILTSGHLHLQRAAVVGNTANLAGGGISAPLKGDPTTGDVVTTIDDSLIANNQVTGGAGIGTGGGLSVFGDETITNSTITGNSVSNPGGTEGGGIAAASNFWSGPGGTLTLLNTTVAGNSISGPSAGFGGGVSGINLNIDPFVTPPLLNNLVAKNTIIAGNQVNGSPQDCSQVKTATTDSNLSGDATCDFTDSASRQNTNPLLGSLANNGGPTNTLLPADSSPAKNTAHNSVCPSADQRGVTRPQALICDIGAVELKAPDLQLTQSGTGGKSQTTPLASQAKRRQKKLAFFVTVANRGEQSPKGAQLALALTGKVRKLKISGGCTVSLKKKRKKGKKKRIRNVRMASCSLGNLAPGASTTVSISLKPRLRRGKVTSTATVSNDLGESSPSGHSATTVVQIKKKKRHR